ncbi:MAG: ABC transporter substrate-binding protein [Chloroflexota bacterium]|nr:ABC transporter substrate-binding protein [Chloroflexota bacterium]
MSPTRTHRLAAISMTFLVVACTATPDESATATPQPTGTGDPIVIGLTIPPFVPSPFFTMSNAFLAGFRTAARTDVQLQMIYSALYRYDDAFDPVPDLAAEPCIVAGDSVTITCTIVETTFHDGTPLTADDVVFTYELGNRQLDCFWGFGALCPGMLESVTALDERTIEFRLSVPNATFLTTVLPSVFIDSRAVVEAAYAPFAERAPDLDPDDFVAASDAIFAQLSSDQPDCEAAVANANQLLESAAVEPLGPEFFTLGPDEYDACLHAEWTDVLIDSVEASLRTSGLDQIATVYPALSFNRHPVGTGPWKFVGVEDGNRALLDAFDGYHLGRPATPHVELVVARDVEAAGEAMAAGEMTWLPIPAVLSAAADELGRRADVEFATWPDATYYMLAYNLREGMLFADRNLRTALELCIDKPATVDAATDGNGDVLYSPVEPLSWAYQPDLPRPRRDVDEARRLIEESGWTEGGDGIYEHDGRRLATDVFVRSDDQHRVAFMDLVAEQVLDCGIELTVVPADPDTVLRPLGEYPHIPGGYDEPFEAVFIGIIVGFDPHDDLWHSRTITSEENPEDVNFMGFSNPRVDELLDEGLATYDQRERARIYREFQEILAEERPVLFAWADRVHEALDPRLALTDGDLNLTSRMWYWQLEKLVLRD